jgi:hypothetical protein
MDVSEARKLKTLKTEECPAEDAPVSPLSVTFKKRALLRHKGSLAKLFRLQAIFRGRQK